MTPLDAPRSTDPDYLQPYRAAVEAHGAGFAATLWGSRAAQQLRFDVVADMADLDDAVVADLGSGTGDLAVRLHERGVAYRAYVGIDALPEVVAAGAARAIPRARFAAGDVLRDPAPLVAAGADWVVLSGTLNTLDFADARRLVEVAWRHARRGVVFNFLSTRAAPEWLDRPLGPARRFDPAAWLDVALDLTPRVQLRHDYLDGHDATIALHRPPGGR